MDRGRLTHDVQKIMNIHHFEELNKIFQEESPPDSGGFDMDKVSLQVASCFMGSFVKFLGVSSLEYWSMTISQLSS